MAPEKSIIDEPRLSVDSERSIDLATSPVHQNGIKDHVSSDSVDNLNGSDDPIEKLQRELDFTREEKEKLATHYNNLLAKLTQMRTSLGHKLKQDAEELDRYGQLVQQLTAEKDDLSTTVETLKTELIVSHEEVERASSELDAMRTRTLQESLQREKELRETQLDLERCRMERDDWERSAEQEKAISEEARSTVESLRRELDLEGEARAKEAVELDLERERSENLQSVLQDFQAAKDHELRQAVKDYESQLLQATQSLADYKHRAVTAELKLEESHTNITRTQELEKEIKEKHLLIGKLRHEAVIMNEHLMEALRRLRRNSTDFNVDRRLVTNVLLSFLSTPRADGKRFEMLSLLASILSWNELEREKAGLQRVNSSDASTGSLFWGRSSNAGSPAKAELDKSDETESFSRLWVEFLLTEASAGELPPQQSTSLRDSNNPTPDSPIPGFSSPLKGPPRRLSSLNIANPTASSPNLSLLGSTPSKKGKERERVMSES